MVVGVLNHFVRVRELVVISDSISTYNGFMLWIILQRQNGQIKHSEDHLAKS